MTYPKLEWVKREKHKHFLFYIPIFALLAVYNIQTIHCAWLEEGHFHYVWIFHNVNILDNVTEAEQVSPLCINKDHQRMMVDPML